jgi:hypothetical protein
LPCLAKPLHRSSMPCQRKVSLCFSKALHGEGPPMLYFARQNFAPASQSDLCPCIAHQGNSMPLLFCASQFRRQTVLLITSPMLSCSLAKHVGAFRFIAFTHPCGAKPLRIHAVPSRRLSMQIRCFASEFLRCAW